MVRTQISFDEELFDRAKAMAKRRGVSLAELCRRGLEALLATEPSGKPWMGYAGIVEGDADDSQTVDSVVYGRETP